MTRSDSNWSTRPNSVAVEEIDAATVRLDFEHKGTDDDSGYIIVPAAQINFEGER
jgi:hypothetical protein